MSVTVFLGRNGFGKDMAAIEFGVLPAWRYGRMVAANCSLYPEQLGYDESLYLPLNEPLRDLPRLGKHMKRLCAKCRRRVHPEAEQCPVCESTMVVDVPRQHPDGGLWSITKNEGCGLLLSDITAAFPSRESLGLPPELAQTLQQLRKPQIAPVMITCPAWARVDLLLRECVTTVVESYPWNPLRGISTRFGEPPDVPWGWARNKAFERVFYDAELYEQAIESGNWTQCPPKRHGWLNRPTKVTWKRGQIRRAQLAYDTSEDIELADHIACGECGGRLPRHSCKNPVEHREHARSMRAQRDRAAYPLPDDLAEELAALVADDEDEREAEQIARRSPVSLL